MVQQWIWYLNSIVRSSSSLDLFINLRSATFQSDTIVITSTTGIHKFSRRYTNWQLYWLCIVISIIVYISDFTSGCQQWIALILLCLLRQHHLTSVDFSFCSLLRVAVQLSLYNRLFQNTQLTVVDGDGTITATRAPDISSCIVNLNNQSRRRFL